MKFVVGDIHGEITKLKQLISQISQYPIEELFFVGDYLDKGENSKETLSFLQEVATHYRCTFLQGDHEYAWLRFLKYGEYEQFLLRYGGKTTMRDFGITKLEPKIVKKKLYLPFQHFFQQLRPYVVLNGFIISHSGINPAFATRPRWETLGKEEFLFRRFDFIGYDKLVKARKFIFGHTAFVSPYYDGWKIGIDTGAVYPRSGILTAFEINEEYFLNNQGYTMNLSDIDSSACPILVNVGEQNDD